MQGSRLSHVKPIEYGQNIESQDSIMDEPDLKFDVEIQTLPEPTKRKDRGLQKGNWRQEELDRRAAEKEAERRANIESLS